MKVIGVNGYARSGKDTIADILVERHGFRRMAFADKLREAAYELNPMVGYGWYYNGVRLVMGEHSLYLRDVIDVYGWDGYKESGWGPEVRRILQRMGTEVGRNLLGENIWVDAVLNDLDDRGNYVFTDCRFANEAESVTNLWGQVWRVDRPGVGPANDHISEIGLDDWNFDVRIYNEGSIEDLAEKVNKYARRL